MKDYQFVSHDTEYHEGSNILHIPDSKPTEKQLASLLKATDSTAVGVDESIGGRTFMVAVESG